MSKVVEGSRAEQIGMTKKFSCMDHFDTFGENFDFDTFNNDTFESVWVDAQIQK